MMVQLKDQNAPFLINVHCMNHYINLVVQTLSKLSIVGQTKDVLKFVCIFFSSSKENLKVYSIGQHYGNMD
jgi:hypothetical protein